MNSLRMIVTTFTSRLERVYRPTLVSYCVFMGSMLVIVTLASIMKSKEMENTLTKIFAYQNHWNKLLNTKRPEKAVKSIDGVRALSMMWVMLAHLYIQVATTNDRNGSSFANVRISQVKNNFLI